MTVAEVFQEISAADFFYRNRDIAGFTSPSRSIYSTIRELVENSLDACETGGIPPDIYVRLSHESGPLDGPGVYDLRIEDNGIGVPGDVIPSAFGQVLYGSKYKLRQTRGTFGLGGKMALLYGQITTHGEAQISSSTNPKQRITEIGLRTDIQHNKPIVLKKKTRPNSSHSKRTIPGRCRGSSNTSSRQPSLFPTLISLLSILADDFTTSLEGPLWCRLHPPRHCLTLMELMSRPSNGCSNSPTQRLYRSSCARTSSESERRQRANSSCTRSSGPRKTRGICLRVTWLRWSAP